MAIGEIAAYVAEHLRHGGINVVLTGSLRLLSPTDCVKDRLAHYYHWKDRQCLDQAVMVATASGVDLEEIERWSRHEGMDAEFRGIRDMLLAAT